MFTSITFDRKRKSILSFETIRFHRINKLSRCTVRAARWQDEKPLRQHFLSGRRVDVEQAIELIARRFPPARYSQVTFKPVNKKIILRQRDPERVPIPPTAAQVKRFSSPSDQTKRFLQLYLPDGSQTDVLVTSVVSCNHIFVQQTLHQSYAELARLDNSMSVFYHHTEVTPKLPRPIQGTARRTTRSSFHASVVVFSRCHLRCTHSSRLVSSVSHRLQQ